MVRCGYFFRGMVDEDAELHRIKIQRVRCRACNSSHSLLYDFLIPYRRISLHAMRSVVEKYLLQQSTYLHILTDAVRESATAFGGLENALAHLPIAYMALMQLMIAGEKPREIARLFSCPNSWKAKKEKKAKRLDWLAQTLKIEPDMFQILSSNGLGIFASGRGCGLLGTHRAECPLF